jgi:hypothetical protein
MPKESEGYLERRADLLLERAGMLGKKQGCDTQYHSDTRFYRRHVIVDIPPDTFATVSCGNYRAELSLELLATLDLKEEDKWPLYYLVTHHTSEETRHFLSWSNKCWVNYFKRLQKRYGNFWEGWFTVYLEEIRRERRSSHAQDYSDFDF